MAYIYIPKERKSVFILVHDPGEYPLTLGMIFDRENMRAMLMHGCFTPGTILEGDGRKYQVSAGKKSQGTTYARQEIKEM